MDSIFWNFTKRKQESYVRNLMMKNMAIIRLPVRFFVIRCYKLRIWDISDWGNRIWTTNDHDSQSGKIFNQADVVIEWSEIFFETFHRIICRRRHSMKIKVKRKRKPRTGFDTTRNIIMTSFLTHIWKSVITKCQPIQHTIQYLTTPLS